LDRERKLIARAGNPTNQGSTMVLVFDLKENERLIGMNARMHKPAKSLCAMVEGLNFVIGTPV